ncbi:hypothetical protein Poli38472_011261 [Pythium oligandrum]|uniref:MYND-type domain-containing protein n=1 Tax=Pythium oligandrum TaxID=41045 RepID=A0A8K1CPX3_PYTOL|nr:hypothetical protein Poli38472_011261 [Pythium oligandrum]|eukprot:TMW67641.1 hypothetical protein Poli38472_011261 [Pythium oligandrum]
MTAREQLQQEEVKLRNAPEDDWMPANVFETSVGRFWGLLGTRDFMRAKLKHIKTLITLATGTALTKALDESLDCLRLCRVDNMGVRDYISAPYIRLHRFQECYDFIKWWATCDPHGTYDWADFSLPYMSIKNADLTEPVSYMSDAYSLSHIAALAFIKFAVAKGLADVISAQAANAKLPDGLETAVTTFLPSGDLAASVSNPKALQKKMAAQAFEAFKMTHDHNKHFGKAVIDPSDLMSQPFPQDKSEATSQRRDSPLSTSSPRGTRHQAASSSSVKTSSEPRWLHRILRDPYLPNMATYTAYLCKFTFFDVGFWKIVYNPQIELQSVFCCVPCCQFCIPAWTAKSSLTKTTTMVTHVSPKCNICEETEGVSACSRCHVVFYCGRDHQKEDFADHKVLCKHGKQAMAKMTTEEIKLRVTPGDELTPDNVFEEGVGIFWSIQSTRDYMRAKLDYLETMMALGTPTSLTEALKEGLDCLRLCRGDNMGVRNHVAAIYVRLNRFQEGYDFIKWWSTCDPDGTYEWGDTDLPYLDIKDADISEPVEIFARNSMLAHLGALTFIKCYITMALTNVINAQEKGEPIDSLPFHEMVTASSDPKALQKKFAEQSIATFVMTHTRNQYYWKAMIDPVSFMALDLPPYYSPGDKSEARYYFRSIFPAWLENPECMIFLQMQLPKIEELTQEQDE